VEYSPDRPIEKADEDKFDRSEFAGRIAFTIANRTGSGSLVLGIYGRWGEGKTSVLNLMRGALVANDAIVVIPFNPWHFTSQEQLLKAFFETLADGLDARLRTTGQSIGEFLKKYGSILSVASVSIAGGVASLNPGQAAAQLGETLSTVEIAKLREQIEKVLRESGKRVVVLIDDIDRLDRAEIQAVFKLVKLSANFPETSYVLAFDSDMVAHALGERYGEGGADAGHQFLEKIIQVPLHLPPASRTTLRVMAFAGAETALQLGNIPIDDTLRHGFPRHFTDGLEIRMTTPRQVVRYANALTFAVPILKGEVDPLDQLLIEGMRVFYPKLYTVVRDNPDCVLLRDTRRDEPERKRIRGILETGLVGLTPGEKDAALDLLQVLFPRVKGMLGSMGGYGSSGDVEWARKKKICSEYYFSRHFTYAVGRSDVADQAIDALVAVADVSEQGVVTDKFKNLLSPNNAERLIDKLRLIEESVSPLSARRLALAVAGRGESYPGEHGFFSLTSAFQQAAILVSKLLRRIAPGDERDNAAKSVMQAAQPLPFALECFGWLRPGDPAGANAGPLSPGVEQQVGDILATRIHEAAKESPPYIESPRSASSLLWVWHAYGPKGQTESYLNARFDADPSETGPFLAAFAPTAWGLESGLPRPGDISRDGYNAISRLIKPDHFVERLQARYGIALDTEEYERSLEIRPELQMARQFAYIHKRVVEEAAKGPEPAPEILTLDEPPQPPPTAARPRSRNKKPPRPPS
jgi:predicted KAP-like P-loop ATPase